MVQRGLAGQAGLVQGAEQEDRPGGRGDGPPDGGGEAGEVEEDEDDGAERGRGEPLPDQETGPPSRHRHTAHSFRPGQEASEVAATTAVISQLVRLELSLPHQ